MEPGEVCGQGILRSLKVCREETKSPANKTENIREMKGLPKTVCDKHPKSPENCLALFG